MKKITALLCQEEGFGLIEICMVIILMGIIGGAFLPFLTHYQATKKLHTTRDHQEKILRALATYVKVYKGLPCPAEAGAEKKGIARDNCALGIARGIVPFRTLGLPESLARDGYGRYFTYIMQGSLSYQGGSPSDYCSGSPADPELQVKDGIDGELKFKPTLKSTENETYKGDFLAVVLISHGSNGYGAFGERGETPLLLLQESSTQKEEQMNISLTGPYIDHPISTNKANYFDDIVVWATRYNLVGQYGGFNCPESSALPPFKDVRRDVAAGATGPFRYTLPIQPNLTYECECRAASPPARASGPLPPAAGGGDGGKITPASSHTLTH